MIFSTKGRYGLMAVHNLAELKSTGPVPLSDISNRLSISLGYLEQIFLVLRKTGIVKSVRGAKGGYILAKEPDEITVGDVLKALEGPLAASKCAISEADEEMLDYVSCEAQDHCATREVFLRVTNAINDVLETTTIQNMLDWHFYVDDIITLEKYNPEKDIVYKRKTTACGDFTHANEKEGM